MPERSAPVAPQTSPVPQTAPGPQTPPTPPVSLSDLLAREDLGLRHIAGPSDPTVVIHWAHASEMADPYPYLLGGELLLTAGVHIPGASAPTGPAGADPGRPAPAPADYFDGYVSRIVAAGGAALGFGLAPVHDTVPRALSAACDRHGLPLLEVPPQTTFSGVARAVWQLMAQARLAELRRVTEAQQSLAVAASRPDAVPSVLRRLAQRLGGHAVLYGPDGTEIAAAGREPTEEARTALAELAAVVRPPGRAGPAAVREADGSTVAGPAVSPAAATTAPTPTSATDTLGDTHLAAYALGAGEGFVLAVASAHREPGDHTIASVAAVLLSLLTSGHQSGAGAARSSALVRLLLGSTPQAVAPLLGDGPWRVVHARSQAQPSDAVAASALGAALGTPLVDLARDVIRVLVPAEPAPVAQPGWTLGVSAAVGPEEWPAADSQAARALARARATRAHLAHHGTRTGLSDLVPRTDAQAHARALLAPLAHRPALVATLRTWLSLHGSWDRTAVALEVHRNTVRQRIARCATLLDTDLDDPDVRMELWFALRQD
ncbi:PucR family transcriptional regulator [Streptomyces sp. MUM 16J]|uniref:PucR family transcriptional regulator n=1 Tax=Streptomyces sp. MUM 16J TaxID=2791988 RepID=UPI001F037729|nr:PucR family transcriptional regulator [Streptomyces sp. MUM 16J]MCH0558932.1 helix-turn-helix domain-containing protein [Streptomyces sp. MUM 16J]